MDHFASLFSFSCFFLTFAFYFYCLVGEVGEEYRPVLDFRGQKSK